MKKYIGGTYTHENYQYLVIAGKEETLLNNFSKQHKKKYEEAVDFYEDILRLANNQTDLANWNSTLTQIYSDQNPHPDTLKQAFETLVDFFPILKGISMLDFFVEDYTAYFLSSATGYYRTKKEIYASYAPFLYSLLKEKYRYETSVRSIYDKNIFPYIKKSRRRDVPFHLQPTGKHRRFFYVCTDIVDRIELITAENSLRVWDKEADVSLLQKLYYYNEYIDTKEKVRNDIFKEKLLYSTASHIDFNDKFIIENLSSTRRMPHLGVSISKDPCYPTEKNKKSKETCYTIDFLYKIPIIKFYLFIQSRIPINKCMHPECNNYYFKTDYCCSPKYRYGRHNFLRKKSTLQSEEKLCKDMITRNQLLLNKYNKTHCLKHFSYFDYLCEYSSKCENGQNCVLSNRLIESKKNTQRILNKFNNKLEIFLRDFHISQQTISTLLRVNLDNPKHFDNQKNLLISYIKYVNSHTDKQYDITDSDNLDDLKKLLIHSIETVTGIKFDIADSDDPNKTLIHSIEALTNMKVDITKNIDPTIVEKWLFTAFEQNTLNPSKEELEAEREQILKYSAQIQKLHKEIE